jgi:hypothetical protein
MGDLLVGYIILSPLQVLYGSLVLNIEASLSRMGDLLIRLFRYLPSATTSCAVWITGPQF